MYVALWRILPGPKVIKILQLLVLLALIVLVLFQWGFPWISDYFNLTGNTVQ